MTAKTTGARGRRGAADGNTERMLAWPGDPEEVTPATIDFEALAFALANRCRRGGHMRHYHSLAAHAVVVSEEIEALDGLAGDNRKKLALHALVADAASAWLPDDRAGSARAADRTARLATGIECAVREAAGLDPVLDEERAELLRFVGRMAASAESRDLMDPGSGRGRAAGTTVGAGISFPPLKRRIRPLPPDKAASAWLKRFRALGGQDGSPGGRQTRRMTPARHRERRMSEQPDHCGMDRAEAVTTAAWPRWCCPPRC